MALTPPPGDKMRVAASSWHQPRGGFDWKSQRDPAPVRQGGCFVDGKTVAASTGLPLRHRSPGEIDRRSSLTVRLLGRHHHLRPEITLRVK
jgi:hypothetical protein